MPLGRFNSFGRSFLNQGSNFTNPNPMGSNPMGSNPMGGNPFPRQNRLRQILSGPGVQSQMPNLMRGLQQKFMPGLGQGGNSQLFGPVGPTEQGSPFAPLGQGGGVPPFGQGFPQNQGRNFSQPQASGSLDNNLSIQTPPAAQPSTQSRTGGWIQDLLSRLRIGK